MTAPQEPLVMTLEEAMRELAFKHMSIKRYVWGVDEPRDSWSVWGPPPGPGEPDYDPDMMAREVAHRNEWPEAVSVALGRPVVARDPAAELRARIESIVRALDEKPIHWLHSPDALVQTVDALRAALAATEGSE